MSMFPEYKEILKADLELYKSLILPDIYEELAEQNYADGDRPEICSATAEIHFMRFK